MQAQFEKIDPSAGQSFKVLRVAERGFPFHWHFHPEYELTLILSSQGRRLVGDDLATFEPGEIVLLGPNLPHTWQTVGDSEEVAEAVVVQFERGAFGERFFEELPELARVGELLRRSARGVRFAPGATMELAERVARLTEISGLRAMTAVLEVLQDLVEVPEEQTRLLAGAGYAPNLRDADQRRIDAVCQWVDARLPGPIAQTEAAGVAHLTPEAFSRFFKRHLGKTFTRYVHELRVGEACRLLLETDLQITDIAYRVGFGTPAGFNRRFLEIKGVTPSAFRKAVVQG